MNCFPFLLIQPVFLFFLCQGKATRFLSWEDWGSRQKCCPTSLPLNVFVLFLASSLDWGWEKRWRKSSLQWKWDWDCDFRVMITTGTDYENLWETGCPCFSFLFPPFSATKLVTSVSSLWTKNKRSWDCFLSLSHKRLWCFYFPKVIIIRLVYSLSGKKEQVTLTMKAA